MIFQLSLNVSRNLVLFYFLNLVRISDSLRSYMPINPGCVTFKTYLSKLGSLEWDCQMTLCSLHSMHRFHCVLYRYFSQVNIVDLNGKGLLFCFFSLFFIIIIFPISYLSFLFFVFLFFLFFFLSFFLSLLSGLKRVSHYRYYLVSREQFSFSDTAPLNILYKYSWFAISGNVRPTS